MKLLLGIVLLVIVFTVDGQDFQNGPAGGDTTNEADGKNLHFQYRLTGDNFNEESQNLLGELEKLDSEEQDHQLKGKNGNVERKHRRSRCKARNACVVMGGFCVTNATLCSGRLVPEGCKGTNCQCCVPGTIEAMFDNLRQELYSLKMNMNNSNSNMNSEMEYLKTNLNNGLQSIKNNISTSNSHLKTELQSIKNDMNTKFVNVNSKIENQGCPEGLFLFTPSNQCFRMLNDSLRNYDSAKAACSALGLHLAQPYDPVSILPYLTTKYGLTTDTWLGARGTGSSITWQRTGKPISSSNPFWWPSNPGSKVSSSYCLELTTHPSNWKSKSGIPYYSTSCTDRYVALCELVTE